MERIDDLIRRLKRTASVSEVARLASVDRATVMRVRDGKNSPNMATFERLLAAVKVAPKRKLSVKPN
jgi:predicted transcriptional regulator